MVAGAVAHFEGDSATTASGSPSESSTAPTPRRPITHVAGPFGEAVFTDVGGGRTKSNWRRSGAASENNRPTRPRLRCGRRRGRCVLVLQAIRRHVGSGLLVHPTLAALGATSGDRRRARLLWAAPLAGGAAIVAAGVAVLSSPLGPIGVARQAELDPSVAVDLTVLGLGALAVAAAVLVAAAAPARGGARAGVTRRRPSRLAEKAPTPPTAAAPPGTRRTSSGAGRTPSLVALPIAVLSVTAAVVFGASLSRATGDPDAYGWTWDYAVGNCSTRDCVAESDRRLEANPSVAAWTGINSGTGGLEGVDDELAIEVVHVGQGWAGGQILRGVATGR